jgi:hypothetical protein
VELLHLGGAGGALCQRLFGRRQDAVQRDDRRVLAQDHGHRAGAWPVRRCSNALAAWAICWAIVDLDWVILVRPGGAAVPHHRKKAGVVERLSVFDHAGLLVDEPPDIAAGTAGLPFI